MDLEPLAQKYKTTVEEILGNTRREPAVYARHEAMFQLWSTTDMTLESIGEEVGGRRANTAWYGIQQTIKRLKGEGRKNGIKCFEYRRE